VPGPGEVVIRIGAQVADALSGVNSVNKSLGETMTTGQKATAGIKKAALPAAAALGAIGFAAIDASKAAMEDAAAQDKLAHQLERVTGATSAQVKAAEDYISKLSLQTGVADDELRPALGKLATATKDMGLAQKDLALALDISAQTGKPLTAVTDALAKGYAGTTTSLGRLVPGMDQAVLKTKDMTKITAELADLTGGAAAESAKTAEGQYKVFQVQMNELKETLGAGLLPVMQSLLGIMNKAVGIAAEHTTAIKVLVGAVAALSGAILAANIAIKAYYAIQKAVKVATAIWTAAQWLLNAALNANPIGLVVTAVAALTAGIIIAYKKSETFRNVVTAAMNGVKAAVDGVKNAFQYLWNIAKGAFDWVVGHWKLALFAFGPIGAAVYVIVQNFDKLRAAAQSAWNVITGGVNAVLAAINSVIGAVKDLIGWIGRIHVPHINLPGPFSLEASAGGGARARGATATAGGTVINVYGTVDPDGTARAIARTLQARSRRIGYVYRTAAY